MRKFFILTILLASIFCTKAQKWQALPPELDGTMMPYDFSQSATMIPDSLSVVHVEYVARHGARYLSSSKKVDTLLATLLKAKKNKTLSPHGTEFLNLLNKVNASSEGKWGLLSPIGIEEERRLAEQMIQADSAILNTKVNAISTYVPRVVESMYIFTYTLTQNSADVEITAASGKRFSELLRFFDTWPPYAFWLKNGDIPDGWGEPLRRFEEDHLPTAPAQRLFTITLDKKELQKISSEMYGVLQSLRATGMGVPTTQWMSESEYRSCWETINLNHYLKRSLSSLSSLPVRGATPLLLDIINSADNAVAMGEDIGANLRFGHAETLLPLSALMGLNGCVALPLDYNLLSSEWKDYEITPLGANIRILYARTSSGALYAGVWLNSRKVVDWTPWTTLRAEWLTRAGTL